MSEPTQVSPLAAFFARKVIGSVPALSGMVRAIVNEPLGGAHRAPREMATTLKTYLVRQLRDLSLLNTDQLVQSRYEKFRQMGRWE